MYPVWIYDFNEACQNWYRVLKKGGKLLVSMEHPVTSCIEVSGNNLIIAENYNKQVAIYSENFGGTPLADRHGGWSVDLPSVCSHYRISDIINGICKAGFQISEVHESECEHNDIIMQNLPEDFTVLAIKQ
jgi:hypothetical protein